MPFWIKAAVLLALSARGVWAGGPEAPCLRVSVARVEGDVADTWEAALNADRQAALEADRQAALPGLSDARRAEALIISAQEHARVGDLVGAERALTGALRSLPGDPDASLLLAALVRDRPEQALAHAEQAVRGAASPGRKAAGHRLVGEILLDLGDEAGAYSSLSRALALAGEDLETLGAMVRLKRGEPVQAAAFARRACEAAEAVPAWQRAASRRFCARTLADIGDHAGALAVYQRVLDGDPDDLSALRETLRMKSFRPKAPGAAPAPGAGPAEATDPARALVADPRDLEALRALAARARAESRRGEAVDYAGRFTAAVAMAPLWLRGDAYLLSARLWFDLGEAERVLDSLHRAQDMDGSSLAAERAAGRFFCEQSKSERTTLERKTVTVHLEAAELRAGLGDPDGAQASLARALALYPRNLDLLQRMIELKLSQRRPGEALPYAERMIASAEAAAPYLTYEERVAAYLKGPGAAGEEWHALRAHRATAVRLMIEACLALGRPERALSYVDRLGHGAEKAPAPERAEFYRRVARLQRELKNEAGAEAAFKKALALAIDPVPDQMDLIEVLLARRRPAGALTYAERLGKGARTIPPMEIAGVYRRIARTQRDLKDESGAERSLQRALALAPDDAVLLRELVELKLAQRRPEAARSYADRLAGGGAIAAASERAGLYVRIARMQRELKDEPGAEASLKSALALSPEDGPALRAFIELLLAQRRPEEARFYADRIVQDGDAAAASESAGLHVRIARMQRDLKKEAGVEAGFKRALELAPDHAPALRELIELTLALGRPEEALVYADRLAGASEKTPPPDHAAFYRRIARSLRELKDDAGSEDRAEAALKRALALAPGELPVLRDLIELLLARRRPQEARTYADRLGEGARKAPDAERAAVYVRIGRMQRELGDEAGAEASLRRALELAPAELSALQEIIDLKMAQRRPGEALSLVAGRWPADARRQPSRLVLLGLARAMLKEASAARDDFSAAVGLDASSACFDEFLLRFRGRLEPYYFDLCVARFPEDPALYHDRGVARYLSGQTDGVLADFRKAVELKSDYPEAHLSLVTTLAALRRPAEASAAADSAIASIQDRGGPIYARIVALQGSLRAERPK